MTESKPNPVVVAVGHDPIDAALAFAGGEAARAGCGLHLIHVVHLLAQGPEMPLVAETSPERAGRLELHAALERAKDIVPAEVEVTTELCLGGVVPSLVETATDARMIVLERRDLSAARRIITRSVSSGVAARARVPVVCVPSLWRLGRAESTPMVTVGVDVPERAEEVLRAGFAEARSRGARLHILHTWRLGSAHDDVAHGHPEGEEWNARALVEVRAAIEALGSDAEGVDVEIEVRHGYSADALVEASRRSDLVVIGRHDPLVPIGSHIGPVARAVVREAECPVMLSTPQPTGRRHRAEKVTETATQPA